MFDLDLIRRAALTSHGRRVVNRTLTTRQIQAAGVLSEAAASGSPTGGMDLDDEDGTPTFVFFYTSMTAPYIVR